MKDTLTIRDDFIRDGILAGSGYSDMARAFKISRQRVEQIARRYGLRSPVPRGGGPRISYEERCSTEPRGEKIFPLWQAARKRGFEVRRIWDKDAYRGSSMFINGWKCLFAYSSSARQTSAASLTPYFRFTGSLAAGFDFKVALCSAPGFQQSWFILPAKEFSTPCEHINIPAEDSVYHTSKHRWEPFRNAWHLLETPHSGGKL